ncbi:pseudouridine synthase [Agathobacter sp.]|uniref:pseudouridine synthase n=1 Tax=Agathobacter sp. TaxID=2021311 RepID=UPI003FD839FE
MIRLDKFLSEMGLGTRSEVKKLLKTKQVTVNKVVVSKPETKVNPDTDEVCLNGSKIEYKKYEYYLFNKPKGCVSATKDNVHGTVMDYITDAVHDDLFPVGRLDIDTEGLLLITNDGALSHELLSPSKHVAKTYFARIDGEVTQDDIISFKEGIDIGEERLTKPAELVIKKSGSVSEIELTITEGKFHQVKRMFEARGKRVIYLKRISMGPLKLPDDLKTGTYRALTQAETDALMQINCGK